MKEIKICEPITVTVPVLKDGKADVESIEFKFDKFLIDTVLVDDKFGKSMKSVMAAVTIRESLNKAVEAGESSFNVDDVHYAVLKDVVEEPTAGYNPRFVYQLVDFLRAVTEAK